MTDAIRISMWSGPRNISTAMMRSFGSRPGCKAVDEPFYAYYLKKTGLDHPMREEVVASQSTDWQTVVREITARLNSDTTMLYIKHMTHHILPEIDLDWISSHRNCFLIRNPKQVIASYSQKRSQISTDDIGIKRQLEIFEKVQEQSEAAPIVIDMEDILKNPEAMTKRLCEKLDLAWDSKMLSWPKGPRPEDGIWARHWYESVENTTGFSPYTPKEITLAPEYMSLYEEQLPYYDQLRAHKIQS